MPPRVAYFNHQKSGCFWYRIKMPMDALNIHGVQTFQIHLEQDVEYDNIQSFQVYGIYPFSFDRSLKVLKADGKRIIYDLDDALGFIDPTNPFYYNVMKDAASEREILKYADHITAATQGIADYMKGKTDVPITIVPNCFNPTEWTFQRPKRDGIRIGFAGSSTHVDDLIQVLPAIVNLQKKYDVKFIIMGFGQSDYESWLKLFRFSATPEANKALDVMEEMMKQISFEWVPYIDFDIYPQTLTNIALDIGLCPLKDTPFNNCRSSSKAMEYTLSCALAVASDVQAYRSDPTSVLVKDNQWESTLETYIKDTDLRQKTHQQHLKWIHENRNINNQIELLKSIYVPM